MIRAPIRCFIRCDLLRDLTRLAAGAISVPTMAEAAGNSTYSAPLAALACWVIPGSGYFLIGQRLRGTVIGVTVIAMFIAGLLIGGIRVIDVPGYDDRGYPVYVNERGQKVSNPDDGRLALRSRLFPEIANKPWFVGQVLSGPICLLAAEVSLSVSHPHSPGGTISQIPRSHARIYEIGTLYTAVAGMLNLLAIIDSAYRAGQTGQGGR